jgi:hypothetical protein
MMPPAKAKMAAPKAKPKSAKKAAAPNPAAKKSENKTQATKASVAAFIDAVADPEQKKDAKAIAALMQKHSGEKPTMWGPSIIGFGTYSYKYDSGREGQMCRIGFSPRKGQTVLYMINGYEDAPDLMAKLGKFKTGKSCLYVKRLSDLNMPVLEELMIRSVKYMNEKYPRAEK